VGVSLYRARFPRRLHRVNYQKGDVFPAWHFSAVGLQHGISGTPVFGGDWVASYDHRGKPIVAQAGCGDSLVDALEKLHGCLRRMSDVEWSVSVAGAHPTLREVKRTDALQVIRTVYRTAKGLGVK
jgi:hypothetical protein